VGDAEMYQVSGGPAGQVHGDRASRAKPDEPFAPVGATTISVSIARPEDEAEAAPGLQAEWALWGKDEQRTAFHVLRCSKGGLDDDDFREIFTRYATGVKDALPQYTVCWIPGDEKRQRPPYLAVGIHEHADPDPALAGGRRQHVAGRVVEYVRLFCFRYADVAEWDASYVSLANAVRGIQLLPGQNEPIQVRVPPAADPPATGGPAELVASWLLTTRPVCVLDADHVPVEQRLAFIDEVLSLLPFGLRARLSASTWASPRVADLQLRLFFSSARRDSSTRTCHVSWARPDQSTVPPGKFDAAEFYREWLQDASEPARARLSSLREPARFTAEDIDRLLPRLPRNKSLDDTFAELAASLETADQRAIAGALKPLKLSLRRPVEPAARAQIRSLVEKYGLLADHPKVNQNTMRSVYGTLIRLAFGDGLSYADYCEIERGAGGTLSGPLQRVLVTGDILDVLPGILAADAGPGVRDEELMEAISMRGLSPGWLVSRLEREIAPMQANHRPILVDFARHYVLMKGVEPAEELKHHGYLSGLLTTAYPAHLYRRHLAAILRFAYDKHELDRDDIVEVFSRTWLATAGPISEVVQSVARPKLRKFAEQEYAHAWLTQQGHGAYAATLRQHGRRHGPRFRYARAALPATFMMIPVKNIKAAGFVLLVVITVVVVVYVVIKAAGG
jgi:hypothetical protein